MTSGFKLLFSKDLLSVPPCDVLRTIPLLRGCVIISRVQIMVRFVHLNGEVFRQDDSGLKALVTFWQCECTTLPQENSFMLCVVSGMLLSGYVPGRATGESRRDR